MYRRMSNLPCLQMIYSNPSTSTPTSNRVTSRPGGVSGFILEPGIGQFREFEPRQVRTRINSLGLFLVHKLTCGKRESVS